MWLVVIVQKVGEGQGLVYVHQKGKELGPGEVQATVKFSEGAPVPL